MKQLVTFLFLAISAVVFSQAPQSIPYQAVVRNTDGTAMANAAVTITFKIHDNSATGTVVYEETHTTITNAQGLVSLNVGGGNVVTGTFGGIQWGSGSKFLHVLMNAGNGVVDLGTQQMMSVPYALYSEEVNVRVSVTGDSLFIGDQVSIVPGVSAANYLYQPGNGVTDIEGNFYPSIIINGQEWMQKNLKVLKYRNGDPILSVISVDNYETTTDGIYSISNDLGDAKYNWYALNDSRGLCPTSWHVPSKDEWNNLIYFLDPNSNFDSYLISTTAGNKMKSVNGWYENVPGYSAGNNLSGLNILPTTGYYETAGIWSNTEYPDPTNGAWYYELGNYSAEVTTYGEWKYFLLSVRCLKD
jgi:uncharacterized protein (TIGR02145 family)